LGFETFTSQLDQVADQAERSLIEHSMMADEAERSLIEHS